MTYQQALQYLNSLTNFETHLDKIGPKDFSLDGFRSLLSRLGDPHTYLKSVHIAGSKGKGSTAVLTAEMLKVAGYRVGLYTSPHLYDVRERIRILDTQDDAQKEALFSGCISAKDFAQAIDGVLRTAHKDPLLSPTYFECLTAAAFLYFYEKAVNFIVLETGLGGRLDATNVTNPLVCGITMIDLEHTRILGDTLKQIAFEKAGIIKTGCLGVVSAGQAPEARRVIEQRCREKGVDVFFVGEQIDRYACPPQLFEEFHSMNVSMAAGMVRILDRAGYRVEKEDVQKAVEVTRWPGRMEVAGDDPLVIIDGAHTAESSRLVAESIQKHYPGRRIVLVLGMGRDKDQYHIVEHFAKMADTAVLTRSSHQRADVLDDPKIDDIFRRYSVKVVREDQVQKAVSVAMAQAVGERMVLIVGSIFLAAEARQYFIKNPNSEIRMLKV